MFRFATMLDMEASGSRKKTGAGSNMNLAWFEGSDVLLDMEIGLSNKKRRRGRVDDTENGKFDAHYLEFLEVLEYFRSAKFGVDSEEEDDDEDPEYVHFLDHLKEHGNAYVCDLSVENGVLSPIVYEEGDCSASEVKRKTARMRIDAHHDRKMWKLKQDGDAKSGKESYGAKNKSGGEIRKRVDLVDKPRSRVKNPDFGDDTAHVFKDRWKTTIFSNDNHVKKNRSLDVDSNHRLGPKRSGLEIKTSEVDECYAKFMKDLHVKGDDVFWDCGDHSRIYYEPRNQQETVFEDEPLFKRKRSQTLTTAPRLPSPPPKTLKKSTIKAVTSGDHSRIYNESRNQQETVFEDEPLVKRKRSQTLTTAPRLPSPPPKTLITSVKKSTIRDVENMRDAYYKTIEDDEQIKETKTDYRKELHEYLRKPYDQEEYDVLLEIVSARKPKSIHRETRSGGFDQEGPLGKSYLDNNEDLRSEIENARLDRGKVLNLLRMFNFYLQKIPSLQAIKGYTKPWKDEFFKTILPGSSNES